MTVANNRRSYHAPRRAEQAAVTRAAIISAALDLFARHGYAATTVAMIAAEARVTPKSVYALADKPTLLLLAVDRAIVGDDEPVALLDRPQMRSALDAGTPAEMLQLAAREGAGVLLRLYPIYRAFEQAVAAEPALLEAWRDYQRRRHADTRTFVRALAGVGGLRPGLSVDRATDTLWALLGWHPVALLVEERGYSHRQITRWLEDAFVDLVAPR